MLITDSTPGVRLRFKTKGLEDHQISDLIEKALNSILMYLPHNSKFEYRERSKPDNMIIEKRSDINLVLDDDKFKPAQYE